MKHFTHFWLALIGLLVAQPLSAQLYEVPLNDRIDRSAYIFEGKVLESNSFYGPGDRMIYTSHLVQVYSVFKGEFPGDQVEIVTAGGSVDGRSVEITHNLELFKGQHGIFFANPTTRPSDRQANSGLSLRVYAGLQGFIRFHFDGINPKASEPFHVYRQPETDLFPLIEARTGQLRRNWEGVSRASSDFFIQYFFSYPQLTQVGGQTYLDFEVEASVSGGSYELGDAGIFIEYDTSLLGSNLAGAGKVTISSGDVTTSTDYSFSATDYGTNVLEIAVDAADPPLNLGEVDAWADDVVKVRVDVTGLAPGLDALFEQSLMQGESEYYDPVSGTYVFFPFVWAVDSVVFSSSTDSVVIDTVYPRILSAGTFDTLYVEGHGFGSVKGEFFFNDANVGNIQTPVPNEDMVWTDTLIKVHIFSVNDTNGTAGSGPISMYTANGDTLENFDLVVIKFAVANSRASYTNNLSFLHTLGDFQGDSLLTFELSDQVSLNSDTADIIREALLRWQCATEINWELSDVSTGIDTISPEGVNLILFSDSTKNGLKDDPLDVGAAAITIRTLDTCRTGASTFYHYTFDTDIVINQQRNWAFLKGDSIQPPGILDFYTTILHELGHAHLLKHVQANDKVMWPGPHSSTSLILRTLTQDDIEGGNWIMDSIATQRANCPGSISRSPAGNCDVLNNVVEANSRSSLDLNIFPNPITEASKIVIRSSFSPEIEVSVLNVMGQVLWKESQRATNEFLQMEFPVLGGSEGVLFIRVDTGIESLTKAVIR